MLVRPRDDQVPHAFRIGEERREQIDVAVRDRAVGQTPHGSSVPGKESTDDARFGTRNERENSQTISRR